MNMDFDSLRREIEQLRNENITLKTKVYNLDQALIRTNTDMTSLKNDTKRCFNLITEFQDNTIDYLHYLEGRIDKMSNIKPILITSNKEEDTNESNIS